MTGGHNSGRKRTLNLVLYLIHSGKLFLNCKQNLNIKPVLIFLPIDLTKDL